MLAYKIFGSQPGFTEGLLFYSCVQDLPDHPDLWLDECPYLDPRLPSQTLKDMRVELVNVNEEPALKPAMRQPKKALSSLSLAG